MKSTQNSNKNSGYLTQNGFNNKTVYLDYFANETSTLWNKIITDLYAQFTFDGIWLDNNEVTGKCNGECPSGNVTNNTMQNTLRDEQNHTWWTSFSNQGQSSTYNIPFVPGSLHNLDHMSMSLNATHPSNNLTEYDVHSLHGHMQGKLTSDILTNQTTTPIKDKRPFIISRSTFAGSGKYVQHFMNQNSSSWADMKTAIAGIMNFNMFGMPMIGPNVCGFSFYEGKDELCGRWFQLATFFPFAFQDGDFKSDITEIASEPWRLDEPYKSWARNALYDRLQYVRHMYTCMFEATQTGQTCFDPLVFHFPDNDRVFSKDHMQDSFIVGDALLVTPVLEPNVELYQVAYLPNDKNGTWV